MKKLALLSVLVSLQACVAVNPMTQPAAQSQVRTERMVDWCTSDGFRRTCDKIPQSEARRRSQTLVDGMQR